VGAWPACPVKRREVSGPAGCNRSGAAGRGLACGLEGGGGKSRLALCLSCPRAVIRGAAALAAYARQRDDPDLAVWTAEIRLRAGIRIGELVRELKVSEQAAGGRHDTAVAPTTTQAVEDAGLNVRTAQRYEELAGLRDEQGQAAGRAGNRSNLFPLLGRG